MGARIRGSGDRRRNRGYEREIPERLLRETIRSEVRAFYFDHPMGSQLIIREGVMDFIDAAMEKGAELARAVSNKFSEGWEALSAGMQRILDEVADSKIEELKSGLEKLERFASEVDSRISDETKNEIRKKSPKLAALEQESTQLARIGQDPDLEVRIGSETGQDLANKARELQQEGAVARRRFVMIESETAAVQLQLKTLTEGRAAGRRGLLKEIVETIWGAFQLFITVVGAIGLLLSVLEKLCELIENSTGKEWAKRAKEKLHDWAHAWHHGEAMMIDYILPDRAVVELYNFYIWSGGAPVEGDEGKAEKSYGDEVFGTGGVRTSRAYEKGKLIGKFGSSRQLSIEDIRVTDDMSKEEAGRRNALREKVEMRIWMCMIFILLVKSLVALAQEGLSLMYGFKSGTKTGEITTHLVKSLKGGAGSAELAAAETMGAEMLGAGAAAGFAAATGASIPRAKAR